MKEHVANAVSTAIETCRSRGILSSEEIPPIVIGRPNQEEHGDFSTNIAMVMAKAEKKSPRAIAEALVGELARHTVLFERVEIAGPGFINFFVSPDRWRNCLVEILQLDDRFGKSSAHAGQKVQIEFVSANPTGPLHVGHGRGAAIGDTLARILAATGWDVTREFYYNDAGQQINNLALSVQARCLGIESDDPRWPTDGYQGDYIRDVARSYLGGETVIAGDQNVTGTGDPNDLEAIRHFAVAYLRREQDQDLLAFDVHFDFYYLESSLYDEGRVEQVIRRLIDSGHTYEEGGALWLRTTDFGDDKDRVMRKSDGSYTYFVPDVAYHLTKWERGFSRVINEQGADHHNTIIRVRAGLQALDHGIPKGWPEYVLHQMVTVMRGGEEVKISKRAGSYVTLRDLIDEVGRDATRFFFIMRKSDSQLVFDIDLAKQQSLDNPVYYVQYAHARICSIFAAAAERGVAVPVEADLSRLNTPEELRMIKALAAYPETVEASAQHLEPHRLTYYLQDLAGQFHSFYNRNRVMTEDPGLTAARLLLLRAVALTLRNALAVLGITAPDKM